MSGNNYAELVLNFAPFCRCRPLSRRSDNSTWQRAFRRGVLGLAISENAERPARLRDGAAVASEVFLPGVGGAALDRHRTLRFVCRIGRDRRIKCGDVSVGPSVSVRVGMVSTFGRAGWHCLHRVIRGDFGARPVNGLRRTLAARCGSYADDKISGYRRRRIGADGRRYEREPARPSAARRGLHWLRVIGLSTRAATFCLAKIWRESGRRIVPRLFPIRTASTSGRMDGPPAKPRTPPPRGVGPLRYPVGRSRPCSHASDRVGGCPSLLSLVRFPTRRAARVAKIARSCLSKC
jgi:hypothetical protein